MDSNEKQKTLNGNFISKEQKIITKFNGSSFLMKNQNVIKRNDFLKHEEALNKIIKKIPNLKEQKIQSYIEVRKGSFELVLFLMFSNPITTNLISSYLKELFDYILNKKEGNLRNELIELLKDEDFKKECKHLVAPVNKSGDSVIFINGDNNQVIYNLDKRQKDKFSNNVDNLEDFSVYEEEKSIQRGFITTKSATNCLNLKKRVDYGSIDLRFKHEFGGPAIPLIFENLTKEYFEMNLNHFDKVEISGILKTKDQKPYLFKVDSVIKCSNKNSLSDFN